MTPRTHSGLLSALQTFHPISLDALNARAALMQRHNRKYILDAGELQAFLAYAGARFDLLEIRGMRRFSYRSVYFDTPTLRCHEDHNKGRRRRSKIRFRLYRDTQARFLEVKTQGQRARTLKDRVSITADEFQAQHLSGPTRMTCDRLLRQHDAPVLTGPLVRTLVVDYRRVTLVARQGNERVTVDHAIVFHDGRQPLPDASASHPITPYTPASFAGVVGPTPACSPTTAPGGPPLGLPLSRWILEVKSLEEASRTDRWLMHHRLFPIALCSKYDFGISLLRFAHRNNRFHPVIRRHFGSRADACDDALP